MSETMVWVRLADLAQVPAGDMLPVQHGQQKLAIFHLEDGTVHVTDNICTHEYALLTDGWLEGAEIECPLHAGRFDIRTGKGLCAPIDRCLAVFETEVRDGGVFVALPAD
jgi:nitrite reductase/ring-hydroxylating ferredoxin subunit